MKRDYKLVEDKCYELIKCCELINHYRVWITRIGKNKKPSIFICRPDDSKYINVGLLSNPELFVEMLEGGKEE